MAISQDTLTTPGTLDTQGSYHTKFASISRIITTISMLSKCYQIQQGMIQVICNGESALKHFFQHWTSNPLDKQFDLIHAIQVYMWITTLKWKMGTHLWTPRCHCTSCIQQSPLEQCYGYGSKMHWEHIQIHPNPTFLKFGGSHGDSGLDHVK